MRALALLLLLAGCASGPYEFDMAGNMYPRECHDLSDVAVRTVYATPAQLEKLNGTPDAGRLLGRFIPASYGPPVVIIDNSLTEEQTADVVRHEKCHARMYEVYGDPRWHR